MHIFTTDPTLRIVNEYFEQHQQYYVKVLYGPGGNNSLSREDHILGENW